MREREDYWNAHSVEARARQVPCIHTYIHTNIYICQHAEIHTNMDTYIYRRMDYVLTQVARRERGRATAALSRLAPVGWSGRAWHGSRGRGRCRCGCRRNCNLIDRGFENVHVDNTQRGAGGAGGAAVAAAGGADAAAVEVKTI